MNELNYASLEASKKLVDNGVVLKTDFIWAGIYGTTVSFENQKWVLIPKSTHNVQIPAPCFTEVWRELPEGIETKRGKICLLTLEKAGTAKGGCGDTFASYKGQPESWVVNANPTDALIDLLIFVRKEKP